MNNLLTSFLKSLLVKYTSDYAVKFYEGHPHKYNLYGVSKTLGKYVIINVGMCINDKSIGSFETPFIVHVGNDFVIVNKMTDKQINYYWRDKYMYVTEELFKRLWSGMKVIIKTDENGKTFSATQLTSNFELVGEYGISEKKNISSFCLLFTNDKILFPYMGGEYIDKNSIALYGL